jgi:hypothetical protein
VARGWLPVPVSGVGREVGKERVYVSVSVLASAGRFRFVVVLDVGDVDGEVDGEV